MKVKIFSLFCIALMFGCESYLNVATDYHYVTNNANKKFFLQISVVGNCGPDTLRFAIEKNCKDSLLKTYFCNSHRTDYEARILYDGCVIYNISDTTSIADNYYYVFDPTTNKLVNFIKYSKGSLITDSQNHQLNQTNNYYLTINDSLLLLMKKNYSMLTKFKEYYKK